MMMLNFNISCLTGIIILGGYAINFTWGFISWVIEKIHFIRLDRYYKKYPEKEKENTEKMAKDFEEIARIIREEKKDE